LRGRKGRRGCVIVSGLSQKKKGEELRSVVGLLPRPLFRSGAREKEKRGLLLLKRVSFTSHSKCSGEGLAVF